MEAMPKDRTDDRLDDFRTETGRRFDEGERNAERRSGEVNRKFDEVNRRIERVEDSIHDLRLEMNSKFKGMQRSMDTLQETVLALHRMMFRASVAVILALIVILATQL
jgi:hypothetical protein